MDIRRYDRILCLPIKKLNCLRIRNLCVLEQVDPKQQMEDAMQRVIDKRHAMDDRLHAQNVETT